MIIFKTAKQEKGLGEGILPERNCSELFIVPEEYKNYLETSGMKCVGEEVYIPSDSGSLFLDAAGNLNIVNEAENKITIIPRKNTLT